MDSQLKEAKTDTWTVSENGHITSVREIHFPKRAHLPESRVSDSHIYVERANQKPLTREDEKSLAIVFHMIKWNSFPV